MASRNQRDTLGLEPASKASLKNHSICVYYSLHGLKKPTTVDATRVELIIGPIETIMKAGGGGWGSEYQQWERRTSLGRKEIESVRE